MVYDFGLRLKQCREDAKLSQTQVAKKLGVTRTTISSYEHNTSFPTVQKLAQLAVLYRVTTDYLLNLNHHKYLQIDDISPAQEELLKQLLIQFDYARLGKQKIQ